MQVAPRGVILLPAPPAPAPSLVQARGDTKEAQRSWPIFGYFNVIFAKHNWVYLRNLL